MTKQKFPTIKAVANKLILIHNNLDIHLGCRIQLQIFEGTWRVRCHGFAYDSLYWGAITLRKKATFDAMAAAKDLISQCKKDYAQKVLEVHHESSKQQTESCTRRSLT